MFKISMVLKFQDSVATYVCILVKFIKQFTKGTEISELYSYIWYSNEIPERYSSEISVPYIYIYIYIYSSEISVPSVNYIL